MYTEILNHLACPTCSGDLVLEEASSEKVTNGQSDIVEGFLACRGAETHTFAIVGGVALLVDDLTAYLAGKQNVLSELFDATDSTAVTSFLAEHLADVDRLESGTWESLTPSYIWAHYDDLDDDGLLADALKSEGVDDPTAFSATHLMSVVRSLLPESLPNGSLGVDVGCSVGGNTHSIAAAASEAVGCDYSFRAVRTARAIRDADGPYEYESHLEGYLTRERSVDPEIPAPASTEFVVADAASLPFATGTVDVALSMNMVDVLPDPLGHLTAADDLLSTGGRLIVCDPYDWVRVSDAAPVDWFGGRPEAEPDQSEAAIRQVIREDLGHDIVAERRDVPWSLRYHPRSYSTWVVDCIASEAQS